MSDNNSLAGGKFGQRQFDYRVIIVQILVVVFLCINLLLILTFFSKDLFYTTMRYILFAVTLFSDSFILIMSDVLLNLSYFQFTMKIGLCIILYILLSLYSFVTPITLTAMTLERYVAICMPLRHGELCSTSSAVHCILIIHGLSAVPCIVVLSVFFASAPPNMYTQDKICSMQLFVFLRWQDHIKLVVFQLYFLIMFVTIILSYIVSYVKIVKVAKAASGENKKSTWKGLRTVILHAFQLLLCLIQLWCPFIEAALLPIDLQLYIDVRYNNYIMFILAPRCLSPLIYGLRDETFSHALKSYASFGLYTKNRI
ncbi:odorant receptor 131-2-like [Gymnodraco acuticeps]|uniref:Odorant receptor 131-2-like n=1 Tax=Gymnodraco acuticeps TaxID=8218 RepID=A0A6P8TGE3_GYMAC|nr:odorant receptor 131-2-like [Gymnodraco acuticeps]